MSTDRQATRIGGGNGALSTAAFMARDDGVQARVATRSPVLELARSPVLPDAVNRCLYVRMAQLETASAGPRFHEIEPRLARWLLTSLR